jgi:hypothetical protein
MAATTSHVPLDPLAPEEALRPPDQPPRRLGVRAVFAALALVFFMAPGIVILVGGAGGALPREQHVAAPRLSQGWRFFNNATRYLTQRLPFRDHAVDANTWISDHVFGETPRYGNAASTGPDRALPFGGVNGANANGGYAQTGGAQAQHPVAVLGQDGWVFLQGELDTVCSPPVAFGTAVERWNRFLRILRASGRDAVLLVVPEKSTVYPEQVAPKTISWTCARRKKQQLWSAIEAGHGKDVVPLRRPLDALKRRELVYLPLDSHWNELGALEMVREALAHVGGGVQVAQREVRVGRKRYKGDIAAFAGEADKTGVAPAVTIDRDPRAGSVGGPTLFLHDSFGDSAVELLRPYVSQFSPASLIAVKPPEIVRLLQRSRTVIVETSERDFLKRAAVGNEQRVLTPGFLAALPRALGPPPGR